MGVWGEELGDTLREVKQSGQQSHYFTKYSLRKQVLQ